MPTEFVGVRVEGLNKLVRQLRNAGADMEDLKAVNKKVANIVLPVALALTPVDDKDGGQLKATGRAAGTAREAIIRFGYKRVPYAGVVHYGTPEGFTYSDGRRHDQKAQGWVAEAASQTEPQWVEEYWQAVMDAIESVGGTY